MPPWGASAGARAGFTLIEALVALVIAGLALSSIAAVFSGGVLGHRASADAATAMTLAETTIAAAGAGVGLAPGRSAGIFAGRFQWEVTVAPYDDPAAGKDAPLGEKLSALRLYRIAATVGWRDGLRRREIALATLRLGPPPP